MKTLVRLGALASVLALGLGLSFAVVPSTGPAARAQGEADHVTMKNVAFVPQVLTVTVGSTVTWTNEDPVGHTATSIDTAEPFGSGTLLAGQSFSYKFNKPGKFDYICEVHPFMAGTVVVVPGAVTPAPPSLPAQPTAPGS